MFTGIILIKYLIVCGFSRKHDVGRYCCESETLISEKKQLDRASQYFGGGNLEAENLAEIRHVVTPIFFRKNNSVVVLVNKRYTALTE